MGEKPYKCDLCKKSFALSNSLVILKRTHTGAKPFKCDICNKFCTTSSNLASHRRIHEGEKSKP